MLTHVFYILVLIGLSSGFYGFYLTLKVLEISERKNEAVYMFFILSGWWPIDKSVVPQKHRELVLYGRISLIVTALCLGVSMWIAITSNEI